MRNTLLFVAIALLSRACLAQDADSILHSTGVSTLKNAKAVVGLLPEAGGRVVFFGVPGGPNTLKCDEGMLSKPIPQPSPESSYFALNGHEIWAGPQQDFWRFQDVNPARLAQQADWPPDPWLETGRFKVLESSPSKLVLEGTESPVTGLKMRKSVSLDPDGSVKLMAEAVNCRSVPVQWDLWSDTKLDGRCRCYVFNKGGTVRIDAKFNPEKEQMLPYEITKGFFSFKAPASLGGVPAVAKAYLAPGSDTIYAFGKDFLFVKSFPLTPPVLVHKSQAPVEIYQFVSDNSSASVLELEFHGAYRKLAPGESMSISETWRLLPYHGADTTAAHLELLSKMTLADGVPPQN